jgi:hypothetical protein
MRAFKIDFIWWRDEAGYEFAPAVPGNADNNLTALVPLCVGGEPSQHERIVGRGGNMMEYRPFSVTDGIYRIFAGSGKSKDGLLDFFNRFGPLTRAGLDPACGEDLRFIQANVEALNELLSCPIEERTLSFSRYGESGLSWSRNDVALVFDPITGRLQLRLTPPTLHNAIWLEFGQVLSSDTTVQTCKYCRSWFHVGPGGRRLDAKFCCADHRIAYNSRKRGKRR